MQRDARNALQIVMDSALHWSFVKCDGCESGVVTPIRRRRGVLRVAVVGPSATVMNAYRLDTATLSGCLGGNTGNVAFVHALVQHVADGDPARVMAWDVSVEQAREQADILVLACANQLGPHADLGRLATHLEAIDLPIVVVGLGAQAASRDVAAEIPDGTRRWLEVVARLAPASGPNIGVRGAYTFDQLERIGLGDRAVVTGCPSNFIDFGDVAGQVSERGRAPVRRVALAAGQPYWPMLGPVERAIADLVDATDGSCIVQHDDLMIRLGQAEFSQITPAQFERLRAYYRPALSEDEFATWCRRNMLCFGNAPSWMNWLKRHDFVLGARFHGIMLALQAGVPGGCITHDSRTAELCETMAVPARDYAAMPEKLTLEALPDLFPFDPDTYRKRRAVLAARYTELLRGCGVPFSAGLGDLHAQDRAA